MDNYFSLLNLPVQFVQDEDALEQTWRAASSRVHPDRFATATPAEKRVAMQWASRINQAYEVLRQPVSRAAYLCELAGYNVDDTTKMDTTFLMKQMQWRETLEEASSLSELQVLWQTIEKESLLLEQCLRALLDQQKDYATAIEKVRQWMFITKIQQEIQSLLL